MSKNSIKWTEVTSIWVILALSVVFIVSLFSLMSKLEQRKIDHYKSGGMLLCKNREHRYVVRNTDWKFQRNDSSYALQSDVFIHNDIYVYLDECSVAKGD